MTNSVVEAKRAYYGSLGIPQGAEADMERKYYEGAKAGTVPSAPVATTSVAGVVKKSAAVADQGALTVTDIATAQTAINALVAKINALLAAERASGQLS